MTDAPLNGHGPAATPAPADDVNDALDALLDGLIEAQHFEIVPGKLIEVRPLMLADADALYSGLLTGAPLQRYLVARCCFYDGKAFGDDRAARLPTVIAARLVPFVMRVNGMDMPDVDGLAAAGVGDTDPKA